MKSFTLFIVLFVLLLAAPVQATLIVWAVDEQPALDPHRVCLVDYQPYQRLHLWTDAPRSELKAVYPDLPYISGGEWAATGVFEDPQLGELVPPPDRAGWGLVDWRITKLNQINRWDPDTKDLIGYNYLASGTRDSAKVHLFMAPPGVNPDSIVPEPAAGLLLLGGLAGLLGRRQKTRRAS